LNLNISNLTIFVTTTTLNLGASLKIALQAALVMFQSTYSYPCKWAYHESSVVQTPEALHNVVGKFQLFDEVVMWYPGEKTELSPSPMKRV